MERYRIAVPIIGPSFREFIQQGLLASEQGIDFLEVRLDYMNNPNVNQIMLSFPRFQKIITARHLDEAGPDNEAGWKGSESESISLLEKAASDSNHPAFIDIELNHFYPININVEKTKLIVSYHNFNETPDDSVLESIFDKAVSKNADIVKIATKAVSLEDSERLLNFTERNKRHKDLIVIGMGENGRTTRIYGPAKGSYLTFACLSEENATASGQMTVEQLRKAWQSIG